MLGAFSLVALLPLWAARVSAYSLPDTTHVFAFGDSYSQNGYDPERSIDPRIQKSKTSTGGRNWIQFLASETANGERRLYDLARNGATVDAELVANEDIPCFVEQVDKFSRFFNYTESQVDWYPSTTLFTVMFGINDIGLGWAQGKDDPNLVPDIFDSYSNQLSRLYEMGARNFLLMKIPPSYRSPAVMKHKNRAHVSDEFKANAEAWNGNLTEAADTFAKNHPSATVIVYDTWTFYNELLDDPESRGFVDSTSFCEFYSGYFDQPSLFLPECDYPLSRLIWKDDYHPTHKVHRLMAKDVVAKLAATEPALVFQFPSKTKPHRLEKEEVDEDLFARS
ncbi:cellulose-binding GDSL lipase/acylhydrolase, carbohydrate Esterase Family 16 protein [Pseudohyphozyma bogoriensis]|nr:cellulose-binding GDSL lipase/acylhydrolase, carbohydrate Esterase Family 16 protein [Pseudohyphozyma bogoriensis]